MKARAMVLEAFNQPLQPRELPIPELDPGQVLVRIEAAGVCGSDIHMQRGEDPRIPLPIILGHEGIGRIAAINGTVRTIDGEKLTEGDRVLWTRGIPCQHCYACEVLHQPWLCLNRTTYGISRTLLEPPYLNGCYADYVILLAGVDLFKVQDYFDPAVLVSASCSGATAAHAFDYYLPRFGDVVLVQGTGPLGLYAVAYAKSRGACVIAIGSGSRLALCSSFGAEFLLDRYATSVAERRSRIFDLTGGRGVDMAIEAAGQPSAVQEGLKLVRCGGTYISAGFSQPPGECSVDFFRDVVGRNLTIQGVWVSSSRHTWQALQFVQANAAVFAKLISHRFSLVEANEALASMAEGDAVKAVLLP